MTAKAKKMRRTDAAAPAREAPEASNSRGRLIPAALWIVALLLAGSAMVYQRTTGPTYPLKHTVLLDGETFKYEFLRSHETTGRAPVELVLPPDAPSLDAVLHWRRFPTNDDFAFESMQETRERTITKGKDGKPLVTQSTKYEAALPRQPAAGKIEYYVTVKSKGQTQRLPPGDDTVVLRYKDPVPDHVLFPHVTAMILVIIVGMRAGLSAVFQPDTTRFYAWVALTLMTVGGMTLGPLVQKYAFGEYWTGFPNGGDWTDNKMLFMWLAWLIACVVLGASTKAVTRVGRTATVIAALVMTVVYLIPHSMGGSQLDYSAIEKGVDPQEAIRTGRQ